VLSRVHACASALTAQPAYTLADPNFFTNLCALQVSAFGSDTQSDGGDVWLIEWESKAKHWKQDSKVCSESGSMYQLSL